jgi:2,3-diketo-5-methylthio-1-phosphopentane phosphatase
MIEGSGSPGPGPVLVSDFDGTMTAHDFYRLAIDRLIPAETPDYWHEYRLGRITHFEALRRYFAAVRGSEAEVLEVVRQMGLDPELRNAIQSLQIAGWSIVVTSAGCDWYIRQLLAAADVKILVHANPGSFDPSRGLVMEMPVDSPYRSESLGIDKTAVVRDLLQQGRKVAFAGDGFPDAEAARLVPGPLRFARGDLAEVLHRDQLTFHPFEKWSEIAQRLLGESS